VSPARGDGDRLRRCDLGHLHWGRYGAAGLLPVHDDHVLLQRRGWFTPGRGRWGVFGGAMHSHEDPVRAALRETAEECSLPVATVRPRAVVVEDHGRWAYHTVIAELTERVPVRPTSAESADARWVPIDEVESMRLFRPFEISWPTLRAMLSRPVLVVDAANVMGSRPDGWWKDRAGAATRLRDSLAVLADTGVTGMASYELAFPEIVLVVEGKARGIGAVPGVRVVDAPGSGDDTIAAEAAAYPGCLVITSDRGLRQRCEDAGATVSGTSWLLSRLPTS
jgi:ADP-ribose pyrophosphatase YjhB (NUDIX family)